MSSLSQFRADDAPTPAAPTEREPLVFQHGEVIAFDQSIANTGWVYLMSGREGVEVRDCGSLAVPPDGFPKGHEGTLLRADVLASFADAVLRRLPVTTVVHETPPVATGKMARPESSLVSAAVIRQVALRQGHPVVMVSNQHSKKVIARDGNADKKKWHAAMERLPWHHHGKRPTNEGQRDAMCLALTYLIDKEPE